MRLDFEKVLRENLSDGAFPIITSSEKEFADWIQRVRWQSKRCDEIYRELKGYKDAEEQGLLLRLPVAEGSEVYVIDFIYECKHRFNCPVTFREYRCEEGEFCEHQYKKHIVKAARFNYAMMKKLGETVFLTREEAEAALAEKGGAE